jgi:hypothetical protein
MNKSKWAKRVIIGIIKEGFEETCQETEVQILFISSRYCVRTQH